MESSDELSRQELNRLHRRLEGLEEFARLVAGHIQEFSGVIIEPPDPEEEEDDG